MSDDSLEIHQIDPRMLRANDKNWRTHPEDQKRALARSLAEFGHVLPVLYNRQTDHLVDGHARVEDAIEAGLPSVPTLFVDWPEDKESRALASLNRIGELAGRDDAKLKALLAEFEEDALGLPPGWTDDDFKAIMAEDEGSPPSLRIGDGGDDYVAETSAAGIPTRTHKGELWACGPHRLLIDDCTRVESLSRLMQGKKAALCLTDPPYSVDLENQVREKGRATRKQAGDAYEDPADAKTLLRALFDNNPADVLVMTYTWNKQFDAFAGALFPDWEMLYECIWYKSSATFIMGRRYQPQHEPILILRRKKGETGTWNVPPTATTVFEFPRPASNPDHPTPRPIEMWTQLLSYHTDPGQIVFDPFLGSGTTLIAAERLGRVCYSCEIQPRYGDMILSRWEAEVGEGTRAELLEEAP